MARQLIMTDPDVHLPAPASSLTTLSRLLARTAQPDAALEPAREAAIRRYGKRASIDRAHGHDATKSASNESFLRAIDIV